MKILLVCKSLNTELGGIQTHTRYLARHLTQLGAEVHLLTAGTWRKDRHWAMPGVTIHPLRYLPGYRLKGVRRLADDLLFNLHVLAWLCPRARQYDLVHVQGRSGILFAALCPTPTPVVVTYHGITREEYQHATAGKPLDLDRWLHQRIFHFLERQSYRRASGVVTVSRYMRGRLRELLGRRKGPVAVISNGVEVTPLRPDSPPRRWVTFLGRLDENKGVRWLPDILARLPEPLGLRIIGSGRLSPWLREQLQRRGLMPRVDWVGPLPHPMVMPLLEDSLTLLVPSIYEPQGMVALEAFERGVPVVASSVGGLEELVQSNQNGWLLPPGDVAGIVQRIQEMYQSPELQQRLGKVGRQRVQQRYQWSHVAAQTLDFYRDTLSYLP